MAINTNVVSSSEVIFKSPSSSFFRKPVLILVLLFILFVHHQTLLAASNYRFLAEFKTKSTSFQYINETFVTNITTSSTFGYSVCNYANENGVFSWQILMANPLPTYNVNTTDHIMWLRYFRFIHNNLQTIYGNQLFLSSIDNITQALNTHKLTTGVNGLQVDPSKMMYSLGGSTSGKISNGTLYFDIPELFASQYSLQMFTIQLNTTYLYDNSSGYIPSSMNDMIPVNMSLLKGSNPSYGLPLLSYLANYIKVINVSNTTLLNYCGSTSPVVAFAWNSWKFWFTLVVILLMLTALTLSLFRPYYCVLFALVVLYLSGVLNFSQATSGFSNEGLISETLLFVIVYPIGKNTLTKKFINFMFGSPKYGYWLCILRICIVCSIMSAFINDTPIVITMIPLIKNWARENNIPPSKFLMPMNIITIAGGLTTLIGTSTNVIGNGLYVSYGYPALTFYEFFYLGGMLVVVTTIYLTTLGLWLLPSKKGGLFRFARERGEQFLCKLELKSNSSLLGKTKKKALESLEFKNLDIIQIIRKKKIITPNPTTTTTTTEENKSSEATISPQSIHQEPATPTAIVIEDEYENIVPVPDDFMLILGDQLIFKGPPNIILQLHSTMGIEEQENIIQTMLGTDTIAEALKDRVGVLEHNTTTGEKETAHASSSVELPTISESPQEEIIQEVEPSAENPPALLEDKMDEALPSLIYAPIPKATLIQKIEEHGLNVERKSSVENAINEQVEETKQQQQQEIKNEENKTTEENKPEESSITKEEPKKESTKKEKSKKEDKEEQKHIDENQTEFFEVVVSSSNPCLGQKYNSFKQMYGVAILAIRHREWIDTKTDTSDLEKLHVNTGDTLLLLGKSSFYDKYREARDFYVISRCNVETREEVTQFKIKIPFTGKKINLWWWEHLIFPIFFAMIGCAIAGYPLVECTFVAFIVIVAIGLISPNQAVECIEWPIIVLIGASLGVGIAITSSGIGEGLNALLQLMQVPSWLLPAFIVFITILVTSVITNNAAVSVCLPLAISVAQANSLNPRCFAIAVIMAASTTFILPIGYQCNLLIMGPGGYSTWDFIKCGFPITVIYFLLESILIPLIWGLYTPNF
ncbi:hypothetical protein FDP41_004425 [Naegleria fowleri]|uniref:Citrate transporter-like domain-containing protein n=1 Tax=Naegleria fowleri TaxID=5763 RepID=A0A6A5BNI4_NAEFO|nr:uncharacterized protein FDP41_004425 [Naegleria fowleri]KAF0976526.1 hypothetical protein FDP41_004425 [Naegleria fowleri]